MFYKHWHDLNCPFKVNVFTILVWHVLIGAKHLSEPNMNVIIFAIIGSQTATLDLITFSNVEFPGVKYLLRYVRTQRSRLTDTMLPWPNSFPCPQKDPTFSLMCSTRPAFSSLRLINHSSFVVGLPTAVIQQLRTSSQRGKICFICEVPDTSICCEECPHSLICLQQKLDRGNERHVSICCLGTRAFFQDHGTQRCLRNMCTA